MKCIIALASLLALAACNNGVLYYNKQYNSTNTWSYNSEKVFDFSISDTNKYYNISFLMQHGQAYPHSNIWFIMYTTFPNGKIVPAAKYPCNYLQAIG
jgi:gliding motility-associated lipoprotein GldH